MMSSDFLHPSWSFSSDLVGFPKNGNPQVLAITELPRVRICSPAPRPGLSERSESPFTMSRRSGLLRVQISKNAVGEIQRFVGEFKNTSLESIAITGLEIFDSVHLLQYMGFRNIFSGSSFQYDILGI